LSADLFYTPQPEQFDLMEKYRVLGIEMETAGIYTLAAELGAEALAICTVSDHIRTGEKLSSADRQTSFDQMIELALETVADRLAAPDS
jgi:purine-nucleoside phosphorylase